MCFLENVWLLMKVNKMYDLLHFDMCYSVKFILSMPIVAYFLKRIKAGYMVFKQDLVH